jgi:hypothetical protein
LHLNSGWVWYGIGSEFSCCILQHGRRASERAGIGAKPKRNGGHGKALDINFQLAGRMGLLV